MPRNALFSILMLAGLAARLPAQRTLEFDRYVTSQVRVDLRDLGYPPADVIPSGESAVTALAVAPNGAIYGTTSGKRCHLFVLHPVHGYVQPLGYLKDVTALHSALAVAASGDVFVGTGAGRLLKYTPRNEEGMPIRIDQPCAAADVGTPVPGEGIYTLALDRERNVIYGLTHPNGQFFRYDIASATFSLHGKVAEKRIPGENFEQEKSISRALALDEQGRVYASGENAAVYRFDPVAGKLEDLAVKLPTVPERAPYERADAFARDPRGNIYGRGLRLPALVRDLTIEFTALSFAAPEKVRFRYMLEGQDQDWKEVVNKREAQYSNLGPGDYRFRVTACNNSGVWNGAGDALEFYIAPAFYQTNWFRVLCASIIAGMLWAAYRLRIRQLRREFNMRVEGRVEERTRIARELHDTLLQSVQGLMFSFQAARNLLPERTEEAMRTLDGAITEGDEAIAEGRNAIQGLRAHPALESNLEKLLAAAGKEAARSFRAEGEPLDFQVAVEGERKALSPLLQDEVYRIARELLRNAFRHAQASRIEAEITYDRQFFRLRIRDNGKGIDRKILEQGARKGHWGLPGVRERAKRIGARLSLWSEPGAGTEAELTVPARIAHGAVHRRGGLRLFRRN